MPKMCIAWSVLSLSCRPGSGGDHWSWSNYKVNNPTWAPTRWSPTASLNCHLKISRGRFFTFSEKDETRPSWSWSILARWLSGEDKDKSRELVLKYYQYRPTSDLDRGVGGWWWVVDRETGLTGVASNPITTHHHPAPPPEHHPGELSDGKRSEALFEKKMLPLGHPFLRSHAFELETSICRGQT